MRSDSKLLLWCLEMQQKFKDVIVPQSTQRDELQIKSDQLHTDIFHANSRIQQLENEISDLEWERPDQYIRWKTRIMEYVVFILEKLRQLWDAVKQSFWKWWNRRKKTHPLYWSMFIVTYSKNSGWNWVVVLQHSYLLSPDDEDGEWERDLRRLCLCLREERWCLLRDSLRERKCLSSSTEPSSSESCLPLTLFEERL